MDDKLKSTIDKVVQLTKQNAEFDAELRKRLEVPSADSAVNDEINLEDKHIAQIYEYCIEKICKKQAEEFYKDFPIKSIIPGLVEDFVRMESFRRKDNFGDFCLAMYQQIEYITNKLCESQKLTNIAEKMWAVPAYVKTGNGIIPSIENRSESNYSIAALVLTGSDKTAKSLKVLQNQYALDKIRTIVYFLGFKAVFKNSDYDTYIEITNLLSDIYQCRNLNHRGNTQTEWEKATQDRIQPLRSIYYFKFMGALAQYVEFVKTGYSHIDKIECYAKSLATKRVTVTGPKIVGKIDLPDEKGRKRK